MLEISVMTGDDDIAFATEMTDVEQWGYLPSDFKRLIEFEPEGCFIGRVDGAPVGIVTSTSYDNFAFIGSLIVKKDSRGGGIGEKLMNTAIDYLTGRGVKTIELDGVFAAASLYRRLGFMDKYLSLRFAREASDDYGELYPCPPELEQDIINFDRQATGLNRGRILSCYFKNKSVSYYAVKEETLRAYALVRKRAGGVFAIGPLVADDRMYAESLLLSLLKKYGTRNLEIGVPALNPEIIDLLLENGFRYNLPSLRMYRGPRVDYERNVYGIFSAEKG